MSHYENCSENTIFDKTPLNNYHYVIEIVADPNAFNYICRVQVKFTLLDLKRPVIFRLGSSPVLTDSVLQDRHTREGDVIFHTTSNHGYSKPWIPIRGLMIIEYVLQIFCKERIKSCELIQCSWCGFYHQAYCVVYMC